MINISLLSKILLVSLFLLSSITKTSEPATTLPETVELPLVGSSSLSVWFFDVYDITLKAPNGIYTAGHFPLNIELIYKRDITAKQLVSETVKQWKRFNLDESDVEAWAELLAKLWPDVKSDDIISFYVDQQKNTYFYFNEEFIGEIKQQGFADAFVCIWLDENGPYPKMTKELIGQKKS